MGGMQSSMDPYVLFWDGDCAFCSRCTAWALARSGPSIRAVPYQQATDPPMDDALRRACRSAVHLQLPDGRMERAGRACLTVLYLVGYRRTASVLRLPPLVWCVEIGYWVVARQRAFFSRFLFRT